MASDVSMMQSTASRASTPSDDTTKLESELASLIRVRNRLALSSDSALPKILTGLLPKVLVKLEATYEAQESDTDEKCSLFRAQIRGHSMGILMHALERIRGNLELSIPWLSVVAVSLESPCRVVRMVTLSFLQTGIPRCSDDREAIPTAILLRAVDQCYRRSLEEPSEASTLELRTTSWLLLDAIAILSGLVPMVDFDLDCYNEEGRLGVYEPPKEASEIIPLITPDSIQAISLDGIGVWDLMLDVLLFWPSPPSRRAADEAITSGGMSLEGRGRMAFRLKGRSWNDMTQGYLRYLKAACFDFCVSKDHPCLFQENEGSIGEARALMLSTMLANGHSNVGKQAVDFLNAHFADKLPPFALGVSQQESDGCSLAMACSLLMLVLGDAASTPIIEQYPNQQHIWIDILGPRPSETYTMRLPLPPPVSARAIEFICSRLVIPRFGDDQIGVRMKLYVDLAVAVQKNRLEDSLWAIRLIHGLYMQIERMDMVDAEWMEDFRSKCLECAKDTLAGLPDPTASRATPRHEAEEGPVHRIIARRRDQEELFTKHRSSLRKKRLRYDDAMTARENSYDLISRLEYHGSQSLQGSNENEALMFDIPIILFKCAVHEETMMKPRATKALSDLLASYKSAVADEEVSRTILQHQAAYLIPSLVDAACCESEAVRLTSAKWTVELLLLIDAPAAFCLCGFLSKDTDPTVSKTARSVVENTELQKVVQSKAVNHAMFEFLDLSSGQDKATLTMELEVRISTVATELGVPTSAASVILSSYDWSPKDAIDACAMDRDDVFQRCGVQARCFAANATKEQDHDMNESFVCGICYDDEISSSDSFALCCGHRYCKRCWESFLDTTFDEGPSHILNATCPNHDCSERITGVELNELCPQKIDKWKDYYLHQFVDQEQRYRFCPGPGCDVVIASLGEDKGPVQCICNAKFCFGCGEEQHVPAVCSDFEKWQGIFGSSEFWVAKNSKPCPNCGVPIEKSSGCNHMQCSQCQYDFCWLCLAHLDTHLMAHTCNQWDPAEHAEDDDEKMRLFFTDRFQAHEEAEIFARKRVDGIEDKVPQLLDKFWLLEEAEAEELVKAEEILVDARRFLKFSYVAVFGMKDDPPCRKIFESHQGALELLTETLSGLTELNLDTLYVERGETAFRLHLRAVSFYSKIVEKYMDRVASLQ